MRRRLVWEPLRTRCAALRLLFFLIVGWLFCGQIAFAQDPPDLAVDLNPEATYHGGNFDFIDMVTGRLTLHIPLVVDHSQRGRLNFTYSIVYSSGGYNLVYLKNGNTFVWQTGKYGLPGAFFQMDGAIGAGSSVCTPRNVYPVYCEGTATEGGFTSHPLAATTTGGEATIDGSGIAIVGGVLTNKHGVQFHPTLSGSSYIEDPNGNELVTTFDSGTGTETLTDTLGRPWTTTPQTSNPNCGSGETASVWSIPSPDGGTRTFTFCYTGIGSGFTYASHEGQGSGTGLSEVILPDGTMWRFVYDPQYGDLDTVYLPTGGSISYTWAFQGTSCGLDTVRVVTSRTVFDGATSNKWSYSYSGGGAVTDPLGNDTVYALYPQSCSDLIGSIQYYSGRSSGGKLIKATTNAYQQLPDPLPGELLGEPLFIGLLQSTSTQWPATNQTNMTLLSYDSALNFLDFTGTAYNSSYGLVISRTDYDYGTNTHGSAISTTNTGYLALSNQAYLAANLLDLVSSTTVLDGHNNKCSETDYGYDVGSQIVASHVITEHTSPPTPTVFGDRTSMTQQVFSSACQSQSPPSTPLNTIYNVYDTGMVEQVLDPKRNPTTYTYSSNYYGAYPTTVTNALGQSTIYGYDFNTGLLNLIKDPNNATTTFDYDDMLRPTLATYPDGGEATVHFVDAYPFNATMTKTVDQSNSLVETSIYDGLGRLLHTQLTSDPLGTDYTDTTYDEDGRKYTVSNPYRSTSDPTYGVTTYQYDALNRPIQVKEPDGSTIGTAYCGSSTLTTDEASTWRRITTDGLGRLVEVDEPNSASAMVNSNGCPGNSDPVWKTIYGYDALGNLISATENGSRPRSFGYDSLLRLTSASNPESGVISYSYFINGALCAGDLKAVCARTDARSVSTQYSYDALNRLTGNTYNDGVTPSTQYCYDTYGCGVVAPGNSIGGYAIGRLTISTTNINHQPMPTTHVMGYDPMGRVNFQQDCLPTSCNSSFFPPVLTQYNFLGTPSKITYPSGSTVTYSFNGAGQPVSAIDQGNSINYATGATYIPNGSLGAVSLGVSGTFTGINISNSYNNRLQPNELKAWSTTSTAMDLSYCFYSINNGACPTTGTGNIGNVLSITNNVDNTRSQLFTYDFLNRISSAETAAGYSSSPANCWSELYSYDAWANLTSITSPVSSSYTGCLQESGFSITPTATNQFPAFAGYGYDLSGNLTSITGTGASSYTYDGESRLASTTSGSGSANYVYDAGSKRIYKSTGTEYLYGPQGEVLDETDLSGNITNEYIYFDGRRIARRVISTTP